jgi:hypothetical protein
VRSHSFDFLTWVIEWEKKDADGDNQRLSQ